MSANHDDSETLKAPDEVESTVSSSGAASVSRFHARLNAILSREKASSAFAKKAGMSASGFHRIEHGGEPTLKNLLGIARAAGVSVAWLAEGKIETARDCDYDNLVMSRELEEVRRLQDSAAQTPDELERLKNYEVAIRKKMTATADLQQAIAKAERGRVPFTDPQEEPFFQTGESPGPAISPELMEAPPGREFVLVPRYDLVASAGPGAFVDDEAIRDWMAFREDFVRRVLHADPKNLALITAVGDSMMPAINHGDLLLVDRGIDRIRDDAIYVLLKKDELVIKRVQRLLSGAVTVRSDNPAYVEETLRPDEAEQIRVAGRVRWIGRLI
jgi:phage repressor protein C with HTH and peptisase S24 domain